MRAFTLEEIERLRKICVDAGCPGMTLGEPRIQIAIQNMSVKDAIFIVEAHSALPDDLAEIVGLRGILNGDHVEAMDRVIGMLEKAEAEIRQLRAEANALKKLVDLCPSCRELLEVPFNACFHQWQGQQLQESHSCPFQDEVKNNKEFLCTCCAECEHGCSQEI